MTASFLILFLTSALQAASPDLEFFKGKIITYIVATKPGGGYDISARLIGRYMQKHIPGSIIIVKNIPGAGHIIGANEIYLAKPNGLTIGTFNTGLIYSQIVGLPGIRFDLTKYSWIGKAASVPRVLVVSSKSSIKTIKDLMESKEPVKMGSSGVGSAANNETLIFTAASGAKIKVIAGYTGHESEMGMMRGEITGHIGSFDVLISFIRANEGRALMQIAGKRHRELPNVPLASELNISPKGKKLMSIVASVAELARLTAAPPGMSEGRLQVLRDAYKKTIADPAFLKDSAKVDMDIDAAVGDEVAGMIKQALNQPRENLALLREIIKVDQ
jgi:tripartite-type tricarboxylate transporter receptor subunit TctC